MAAKDARPHRQSAKTDNGIKLLRQDFGGVERGLSLPIYPADPSAIRLVLPPVIALPPLERPLLELRDLNDGTVMLRLRQRLPIATIEVIRSKLTAVAMSALRGKIPSRGPPRE